MASRQKKRVSKEGDAINSKEKRVKKPKPGQREPAGLGGGAVMDHDAVMEHEREEDTGQRQQAERNNPRDKRVEAEQNRGQTFGH
jgi:hypothetical protein